jgi:hypothetical protein
MKVIKAIASLVLFASLGGFGAIDVVQSFQPVRAVALTAVLGFGGLINDTSAAFGSPKSVIPRVGRCSGNKLPCSMAMGRCAAGAAVAPAKSLFGVPNRLMCIKDVITLFGSSSNEDVLTLNPFTSVWVQLYVDNVKAGRATKVKMSLGADVYDLTMEVKLVCSNALVGIDATRLKVYKWNEEQFTDSLPGDGIIDIKEYGGGSLATPIRVAALTSNQGMPI